MRTLRQAVTVRTNLVMATRLEAGELVAFGEQVRWELRTGAAVTVIVVSTAGLREVVRAGGSVRRVLAIYFEGGEGGGGRAHARKVYTGLLAAGATGAFDIEHLAEAITGAGAESLVDGMVDDLVWLQIISRAAAERGRASRAEGG